MNIEIDTEKKEDEKTSGDWNTGGEQITAARNDGIINPERPWRVVVSALIETDVREGHRE
jgi:hypothetical protein